MDRMAASNTNAEASAINCQISCLRSAPMVLRMATSLALVKDCDVDKLTKLMVAGSKTTQPTAAKNHNQRGWIAFTQVSPPANLGSRWMLDKACNSPRDFSRLWGFVFRYLS